MPFNVHNLGLDSKSYKYLGLYEVTKIKRVSIYDIKKVGNGELTSTSADFKKLWISYDSDSSKTDEE